MHAITVTRLAYLFFFLQLLQRNEWLISDTDGKAADHAHPLGDDAGLRSSLCGDRWPTGRLVGTLLSDF